jgi:GGDEF domain-containing protein
VGLDVSENNRQEKRTGLRCIFSRLASKIPSFASNVYYRSSLRAKILVPTFVVTLLVIGILTWLSFTALYATITGIYEQRARSVAGVVSKSIQDKEYILYYSDQLDSDINTLMKRHEAVVMITVTGITGRGLRVVSSTDSSLTGRILSEENQADFIALRDVRVSRVQVGSIEYLRADYPLFMDSELMGVVSVDMSLAEQQSYIARLSWQLGIASLVGFLVLGALLYLILKAIITRPIFRLAKGAERVSQRDYSVTVSPGPTRSTGTKVRDEIAKFIDVFNLMIKMIGSHEHALRQMVMLDDDTGSYTLAYFERSLEQEIRKGERYGHPASVLIIDVAGTQPLGENDVVNLLLSTSNFLTARLRSVDLVSRVSKQRFAVLLPETAPDGAQIAADRLNAQADDLKAETGLLFSITVKIIGWSGKETPRLEDVLQQVRIPDDDSRS